MSTIATYKTLDGGAVQEITPDPAPAAGYSLNTNFRAIADSLPRNNYGASTNPSPDNDSIDSAHIGVEFSKGSRWYNGTAIFECVDPTPTAAVWISVAPGAIPTLEQVTTAGATTDQALTLSGGASFAGSTLNMNDGSGSGGGILNMDGNEIVNVSNLNIVCDGVDSPLYITGPALADGAGALYIGPGIGPVLLSGNNLVMNDGSGSGGGNLSMDGGLISFDDGQASIQSDGNGGLNFNSGGVEGVLNIDHLGNVNVQVNGIIMGGQPLNMGGYGSPGTVLNLDGGNLNLTDGGDFAYLKSDGSGGIMINLAGSSGSGTLFRSSDGALCMGSNNVNMNDGSGSGGGNISMDGGTIVRMRADNQSSAPSSPAPGQIYFNTTSNHFFGWNGTAWKQLDN